MWRCSYCWYLPGKRDTATCTYMLLKALLWVWQCSLLKLLLQKVLRKQPGEFWSFFTLPSPPPPKKTNNGGLCSYLELSNCPILAVLLLQFKHYFMFFWYIFGVFILLSLIHVCSTQCAVCGVLSCLILWTGGNLKFLKFPLFKSTFKFPVQ